MQKDLIFNVQVKYIHIYSVYMYVYFILYVSVIIVADYWI